MRDFKIKNAFSISILFILTMIKPTFGKIRKLPPQDGIPLVLGMGYSTDWETFTFGECITGTSFYDGQNQSLLDFKTKIEYEELQKQLGLSAGFRYKKGFTSTSASASFLKASKSNTYSISAVYNGSYKFKDQGLTSPTLTAIGMQLYNKPDQWSKTCGDYYTAAKSYGGKIFFQLELTLNQNRAKEKFSFRFKFASPMTDVGASINKFKHEFSKNTEVKVSALQLGGDVTRLSNIFHGSTVISSGDSSYSFVKCSFSDFESCQNVLKNAISYSSHDFPKQFKKMEDDSTLQYRPNASLMSVTMAPYTSAGIHIGFTTQMTKQIKLTRKKMESEFDKVLEQFQRTNSILENLAIIKSPRQSKKLNEMKSRLFDQMNKIVDSAEICLDDPIECASEYKRVQLSTADNPNGFKLYSEDDFKIELETYAQFCDFGLSPWSTKDLSNTVKHLINISKFQDNLVWNNLSKQGFGVCYISEQILQNNVKLDLSFDYLAMIYNEKRNELEYPFSNLYDHKISDLRVIMTFNHWKVIDLSNQNIKSSREFRKQLGLESLELRGNELSEFVGLLHLSRLEYLGLSDNEISSASLLTQMENLKLVDLSNNTNINQCPFVDSNRCLLTDISQNNQLFSIHRPLNIRRWGHQSLTLKNGNVLITGGAADKRARYAEVYDDYMGLFQKVSPMNRFRYEHRMNLLNDGRVLITGGGPRLILLNFMNLN